MGRTKKLSKKDIERLEKGLEPIPLEVLECERLATRLRYLKIKFSHIPNETRTPSQTQKKISKKIGVNSGVPDYLIILPRRFTGLSEKKLIFIEMKRQQGGNIDKDQKEWLQDLNACVGVDAYVAKGYDAAKNIINKYASDKVKSLYENM